MPASPDHERVSRIFLAASRLDGGERETYLSRVCDGDAALRNEVASLLAGGRSLPPILATGALPFRVCRQIDRPPERIGEFRVLEQLGEGGMGIVYRAEQQRPVRRPVAIKLIKRGFETEQVLARFELERSALALMSHPNVAMVLDAGLTEDGRPYIVMEYVDGEPITEYCDRRRLRIRERLELFVAVCDGVQHAHHKSIVHRDIKPSNVLVATVSGRALPKIIDFGVAKATGQRLTERSLFTERGQMVGTPEYMSPEQAEMDDRRLDTRTDVYALGVLLYELLAGVLPFDPDQLRRGSFETIRRRILEEDPPRPSVRLGALPSAENQAQRRRTDARGLARSLRGDLDWIVIRAMEKQPERRYASPGDLAEDIKRHLLNEPVVASPPSRAYRAGKFARKHRFTVSFAAVVLALLVGFAASMTALASRLARERARADTAAQHATSKAEAALQVSEFLVWVFSMSGDLDTARRQLDAARSKVERDFHDQPARRARLMLPLGQIYDDLGFDTGETLMGQALAELRTQLGEHDPEVLAAMHARGVRLAQQWQLDGSESMLEAVREIRLRQLGPDHPDTLAVTAHLGLLRIMQGRLEEAGPLLEDGLSRATAALGSDHPLTLRHLAYLGSLHLHRGELDLAEEGFSRALERSQSSIETVQRNAPAYLYHLGSIEALRGKHERALELIREAIDGGWVHVTGNPAGGARFGHDAIRNDPRLESLRGRAEFEAMVGPAGYMTALDAARDRAWARDFDEAFRWLRLAVERGFTNGDTLLRDTKLASLQGHPEFEALVAELRDASARP